jgi:hypothetical protein
MLTAAQETGVTVAVEDGSEPGIIPGDIASVAPAIMVTRKILIRTMDQKAYELLWCEVALLEVICCTFELYDGLDDQRTSLVPG